MNTIELRELMARATGGTWYGDQDGQGYLIKSDDPAYGDRMIRGGGNENHVATDLDLIVAAVNMLPKLLDVVEAAKAALNPTNAEMVEAINTHRLGAYHMPVKLHDALVDALAGLEGGKV